MKIIDLLNKIANGEEVPKFKYRNILYEYNEKYKELMSKQKFIRLSDVFEHYFLFEEIDMTNLNDEVEIIEEEIKPLTKQDVEALGYACGEIQKCFTNGWKKSLNNEPFKEDKKIEKLENEIEFYSYVKYEELKNDIDKVLYILKAINLTENKINNLNDKLNEIIDILNKGENND